jgi:hypothetical protein
VLARHGVGDGVGLTVGFHCGRNLAFWVERAENIVAILQVIPGCGY